MDETRPFEYTSEGTFFQYMTPESLARMNPELRVIQERLEVRCREMEAKHSREELERIRDEEEERARAFERKQRQYVLETQRGGVRATATREQRFVTEWRMVVKMAKREGWTVDTVKARLAGCVARHLGQDDARGRGRAMDVFEKCGGRAARLAVISLLREGVSTAEGFKWLEHRAGQYEDETVEA